MLPTPFRNPPPNPMIVPEKLGAGGDARETKRFASHAGTKGEFIGRAARRPSVG